MENTPDFPNKGFIYIIGKINSYISFFISRIKRKIIFFYDQEDEALLLKEEMEFFSKRQCHLFPLFTDKVFEKDDELKRIGFLKHLVDDDDFIGLFPYNGITHILADKSFIKGSSMTISIGDTIYQEELIGFLDKNGYEPVPLVREGGEYAKRGSIIDIFPPSSSSPVRIEFLGDEVYSIRFFDPLTQRSKREIENIDIPTVKVDRKEGTILDYLDEGMVFVHNGINSIVQTIKSIEAQEAFLEKFVSILREGLNIDISGIKGDDEGIVVSAMSNDDLKHIFERRKTEIFHIISERIKKDWQNYRYIYLFANNQKQAERLKAIFEHYDVFLPIIKEPFKTERKEKGIVIGPLRRGFKTDDIVVLTEEDIVGPKKRVVKRQSVTIDEFLNSFKDLKIGEWVVHVDHGIGIYKGIEKLTIDNITKDFILIEYQDGDKLYVPIDNLYLVQKYIGGEKHKPKIDKLGTNYWKNTKSRVKRYVENIAKELIEVYAARELAEGYSYSPEDELYREMESRFEYEETEGQARAIEEVLEDLKSSKPMDRIVCGDVGFGKTEVALRASFKVVMDNKQVAVLVPTTILAQQHYRTFTDRFKDYPINIEVLSRFRTDIQQKEILNALKKGKIDIIIGTHRILQDDVVFKDLGLLIIDEEHRFGVKHKEKLKILKKNIDVLTLSATPIPRTLYMATMGLRDLSIIDTPPLDRLAIKTYVVRFKDEHIKKGIMQELQRGGQVFFMHNFIHNIGVVYDYLHKLIPDMKIAVAHGKMPGRQLEKIMLDFIDRKYDLLLSTNIIESGLDITNANTIFINNAHRLGLADLYQLRGRVGRGVRQAYAYLLVPKDMNLTKDAALRLKIMEELTALGSGFQIANYDLEIRGAGNLLGHEQSGNINLIGFELYCRMLEEAVRELKGREEIKEEEVITQINIPVEAYIPDSYIEDPSQKLLIYKRLSKVSHEEELLDLSEEIRDRYGEVPDAVRNLFEVIKFKIFLSNLKIRKVEHSNGMVIIYGSDKTPVDTEKLFRLIKGSKNNIKIMSDNRLVMKSHVKGKELMNDIRNLLLQIISV
ncbi:MAG: transcription-repair coupling factor [Syntrophorhabdaceae bacterium]|nr:transcription-repair coupling factor [Syntrophorhabdaceae bacterium]